MNIALLDTAERGEAMAQILSTTRHGVVFGGSTSVEGHEAAERFVGKHGIAVQGGSFTEAIKVSDIVILLHSDYREIMLETKIADFRGKIVVDGSTSARNELTAISVNTDQSAVDALQEVIEGVPVVKAFNTISSLVLRTGGHLDGRPAQVFCASNDDHSARIIAGIVSDMGMEAICVGPLSMARFLEPLAKLNLAMTSQHDRNEAFAPVWLRETVA